jgi:NAD(P)-dependent dehydrogenase (short-subunit alcohol dehydrogenase family)
MNYPASIFPANSRVIWNNLMAFGTKGGAPMGRRLEGKVAAITAGTSGMALATAPLFVQEGAYVFITGRRQDKLDEAVRTVGRNVTGIQGDASNLDDPDRLYETVRDERGEDRCAIRECRL